MLNNKKKWISIDENFIEVKKEIILNGFLMINSYHESNIYMLNTNINLKPFKNLEDIPSYVILQDKRGRKKGHIKRVQTKITSRY